jgi:hypothetical protein
MSDPDRIRQREHWQAIAEQLGLSPEADDLDSSEPSPAQAPAKREEEPAIEPAAPRIEPVEQAEEPLPRRGRRSRSARTEKEPPQPVGAEQQPGREPAVEDTGTEPASSGEERPSGKRGRRRRSERTSAVKEEKATDSPRDAEAANEAEESSPSAERPKRRGRGRGRQKKAVTAEPVKKTATDEETGDKVSVPADAEAEELDDVRSLSNWNVPSWNELIASLYRPER